MITTIELEGYVKLARDYGLKTLEVEGVCKLEFGRAGAPVSEEAAKPPDPEAQMRSELSDLLMIPEGAVRVPRFEAPEES